ncbi:hypothetical protein [Parabacteroides pacaensis]|uniref:hypothetical protein n=1 Tax=Parabacteroides pacaensis TaxID=2086575 RepID=UPI00131C70A6|nr:hypothetical protein [Parabacteroides pacaensis]
MRNIYNNSAFQVLTLILASIIVYFPILGNDFVNFWDDQWQVMNYYTEGRITWENLHAIFTEFYHGQYSPVNATMYLFIYTLFGYNPLVFHLVSLLLHVGCACLVYFIIKRMCMQTSRIHIQQAPVIAWITALIFVIHPMNVEAVAWISASKILVYVFFYLAATYTFLLFLGNQKIWLYVLTLLLFTLSFGGKEQAVTFPVWLLMIYWLSGYSFKTRKVWIQVAPFFLLAFLFGVITLYSNASVGSGLLANEETFPLWQRFILGCYSFFEYLAKFIFPYNLLYIYPFPILIGEALPDWMLLYPVLIVVIAITLQKYILKWPVATGLVFFLINIGLVLHIVPLSRFAVIADRYIYLPSIGLAFIIAYYFVSFVRSHRGAVRNLVIGGSICMALYFCIYSNLRSREWKDTDSIKKEIRELIKNRDDYPVTKEENVVNSNKTTNK